MSRVVHQAGMRLMQGMKDQASKYDTTIKSLENSTCGSSSRHARMFCGDLNPTSVNTAKDEKLKRAEESLRTVMFLSCWGPN